MESYEMILAEQVYFVNNSNIRKQKLLLNSIYIILAIVGHILLKVVLWVNSLCMDKQRVVRDGEPLWYYIINDYM